MKVLLLSCSTGGGHNSCAHYIEEELKANNIECIFKDFYDIVNINAKELSSKLKPYFFNNSLCSSERFSSAEA